MTYRVDQLSAQYDAIYAGAGLHDSPSAYAWALNKLRPRAGAKLLDVACGEGELLRQAAARGLDAYGVDFSRGALARSRQSAPAAHLALADGEHLPFPDHSLDYVTCLGSLEHYLDLWRGVSEIARVLTPAGTAAILLPNSYYLADIVWHVWRTGRGPDHHQAVQRFATAREWADVLTMMGLEVVKTYRQNLLFPRSRAEWRWYLSHPTRLLYLLSGYVTPLNLSYCFLYLCRPAAPRPELGASLPLALRCPERD
jgi:SAM-dependent methyltransferase